MFFNLRRTINLKSYFCVATLFFALISFAMADDWPQWQGPDRNGVSKEKGLLQQWPSDGPPLAWRVGKLGGGFSTPSVARGHIFGMSYRGDDEVVWAWLRTVASSYGPPKSVTQKKSPPRVSAARGPVARRRWTATFCTRSA